jgi:phytoene desaturase
VSRIVVIGAGVGGLACALHLAAAGHTVTVMEQADTVGGKLGRRERTTPHGVFRFDTGPSLLTLPQVFAQLFAVTGSTMDDELDITPLDPIVRHVFPDSSIVDSCADHDEFVHRITVACGPTAGREWHRLWRRAQRVWEASWRHVLRSPARSPADLARLAWRLRDLAAVAPGRTLRGVGRAYLSDPRLRMLLDRYATYAGSDPRRAPAALLAIPYAELAFGGWYVRGGLANVADALARRCAATGVHVRTGTAVSAVHTSQGRAAGVQLADGEVVAADVVVANADAAAVYRDLLPTPGRAARLSRRGPAGVVLLLGVRGRTPGLAHHTVVFPPDYDAEFDAIFGRPARPVPDPTIFVTVADDPLVRPDGYEAWFVLVNAPPHGRGPDAVDWRQPGLADAYADRVLATLAARGLDVRDRLLFREVRTPADLAEETATPGGAIYGTPRHGVTGLLRPPNRGPVPGLYLVGGSTHPGGGLPMVALSAGIVARHIGPA